MSEDNSKYKDGRGRWRTQSLFLETSYQSTSPEPPLYTMRPDDHHTGLPSFRRLYLETSDPTEYTQATTLVGGWEHWQALLGSKWFSDYIVLLREEMEIKLRSEGILKQYQLMNNGQNPIGAARYFSDGEFIPRSRKRGRPSKEEVTKEARKQAEIERRVQDDAKRLGLTVVTGKKSG